MKWNTYHQFGHDVLGPVVHEFIVRLHSLLRSCDDSDHKILFSLRAGLRIADLYHQWGVARKLPLPKNIAVLKISRMMAVKAAYGKSKSLAVTALGQELANSTLDEIVRAVLNKELTSGEINLIKNVPQIPLHDFVGLQDETAKRFNAYLEKQSQLFDAYLSRLVGKSSRIILVDSGWRATSQLLLEQAFPKYQWEGVYFGCMGRAEVLGLSPRMVHGLIFDSDRYVPGRPETALATHRHLVESLFEPGLPSTENITAEDCASPPTLDGLLNAEVRSLEWDEVYEGVRDYVVAHANDSLTKTTASYHAAIENLANLILYPAKSDLVYLVGKPRTHDMGRAGEVPTILPARNRFVGDSWELRIRDAIWRAGQISLEFPKEEAKVRQVSDVDCSVSVKSSPYFVSSTDWVTRKEGEAGTVAIITRTKNRPLLLKRAAESVASQSYDNYIWVVVNDGGDVDEVLDVVRDSTVNPAKIIVCNNKRSLGMEAASNAGIRSCTSEYIVIHDDDDSWHPNFLKMAVAYLEENSSIYGGVITRSVYVSEEVVENRIVEHGRWPYKDWVSNVHLAEMVVENFFPPISFVFRRSIGESIGLFDQKLPVLGDWDFNIRFLMKSDIGVIPESLAYYHHRDRSSSSTSYSNSVIGGVDRHAAYSAIVRNKYIRESETKPELLQLSILMAAGFNHVDVRSRLTNVTEIAKSGSTRDARANLREAHILQHELLRAKEDLERVMQDHDRVWVAALAAIHETRQALNMTELLERSWREIESFVENNELVPPPDFDSEKYLQQNPDVMAAVAAGVMNNAYTHYMRNGRFEGRVRPIKRNDQAAIGGDGAQ